MKGQLGALLLIIIVIIITTIGGKMLIEGYSTIEPEDEPTPKNLFCGDEICSNGETCDTCPYDCKCVNLKLDVNKITPSWGLFDGCFNIIEYSVINTGNTDAKSTSLYIKSEAPHLSKIRDTQTLNFGTLSHGMQSKTGSINLKYNCEDDIIHISMILQDSDGNEVTYEKTLHK